MKTFFSLVFVILAAPAFADSFGFDLPRLEFPEPVTTVSTSGTPDPVIRGQ